MRTAFFLAFMVGLSTAAMQQRPAPVYNPQVSVTGSSVNANVTPLKTSAQMTPAPIPPVSPQPVAQARESIASEASGMQPTVVNPNNPTTPAQNYYVYYYPHQAGTEPVVGQPNSSSIWSWTGWNDVAAGVGSVALVLIGGGILYYRYGSEVKSRALRELKDLSSEDVTRMTRGVFRALEKFSAMNNDAE